MAAQKNKNEFLMYKNRPLVRKGNTIYYGSMSDAFVLMLQILTTKQVNGVEVADKVSVQLINTDPNIRPHDRIAHKTEKKGLVDEVAALF